MTVGGGRNPPRISREPIRSDRVRRIDGTFAFVPHRFLRDGFYASLTPEELALYLLLVIAGDRHGVSFYHYDSLCSLLQVDVDRYIEARNALIDRDLIAFDGTRFQVLSLPPRPASLRAVAAHRERDDSEAAEIRRSLRESLRQTPPHEADEP